mgnify:CR=1 FL=1
MFFILGFLICAAFAALIISGLTQACTDVLQWAEKRNENAGLEEIDMLGTRVYRTHLSS